MQATAGATAAQTAEVLRLAALEGTTDEILSRLDPLVAGSERGAEGVARLDAVLRAVEAAGVAPQRLALDVSIARGLDYYTGTIYETFLDALPEIGSVCSAGATTTWPSCSPARPCPGSAPRSDSTGCWPRWKSWG
jgi:histidyl-tRNA synthetase